MLASGISVAKVLLASGISVAKVLLEEVGPFIFLKR